MRVDLQVLGGRAMGSVEKAVWFSGGWRAVEIDGRWRHCWIAVVTTRWWLLDGEGGNGGCGWRRGWLVPSVTWRLILYNKGGYYDLFNVLSC